LQVHEDYKDFIEALDATINELTDDVTPEGRIPIEKRIIDQVATLLALVQA